MNLVILPVKQCSIDSQAQILIFGIFLLLTSNPTCLWAQNVQTGHYAPGWNGTLKAGMMTPDPGLYMQSTTVFYNAQEFRDGSGDTVNKDETDYILTALIMAWRPDFKLLGGDYQAALVPAIGNLSGIPVLVDGEPQDAPTGFADLTIAPIGLGWHWSEFHLISALSVFAPTGKYKFGESDNTGLGFWTAMPYMLGTYRTEKGIFRDFPLLATGGVYYEIHSNQQGRDFRPGDSFTFEWSLGMEFAERTNFGLSGYFYRQVTDPSGADAKPVDKYQANGIGLTFSQGIGPVALNLRGYRDFDVKNGPDGTLIYIDIAWGWPHQKGDR